MTYREMDVAALCALALLLLVPCGPLEASRPTYQGARIGRGDDVTLAAMCLGEAGTDEDACTAMVGVVARTADRRGLSLGTQARAYSAIWRTESRPWLLELDRMGRRPPSWPRASWTRHRAAWMALLDHVQHVLTGDVEDPCPRAEHFGSARLDGHRMRAFDRVCVELHPRQAFWGRR